jgi:hypothetical protein
VLPSSPQNQPSRNVSDTQFAADVLTGTGTRDVRIKDFERVPCVRPLLREFDADELLIIESYDDTGPIE